MITSVIGRIFLDLYNEKFNTSYNAKTFFDKVYHPLFFESNKYLQWFQNSPFVQMKKGQSVDTLSHSERQEKLSEFHDKIDRGYKDASVAIGYAASEEKEFATTSGQVSNINISISKDDIYLSWIGSSFGIGLQSGMSILFTNKEILLDLFEGWNLYRKVLNENNNLRGNQLTTWNGQWLAHKYSRFYNKRFQMANFQPFETKNGTMSVKVISWTKVLIGISRHFSDAKMIGYVYNFGQMNTTIGFIPFNLIQIRRPLEFYQYFFGMDNGNEAEELWGTEIGFKESCKNGVIGLKAMKPKGLQKYMDSINILPKTKNYNQIITYNTYIIWILAMLNNKDLWDKSKEFAQILLDYSKSGKKSTRGNSQKVSNVLDATNKKNFISALTEIVVDCENKENIVEMAKFVNSMPSDNVPYFLTLLRFCYSSIN